MGPYDGSKILLDIPQSPLDPEVRSQLEPDVRTQSQLDPGLRRSTTQSQPRMGPTRSNDSGLESVGRLDRTTSSANDLQNYRYKPRDTGSRDVLSRDSSPRDSIRELAR